jgi:ribonuclease HI
MRWLLENSGEEEREPIQFLLDSQLVERQLSGIYKIKEPTLQSLAIKVKQKIGEWGRQVIFTHVPRNQNKDADRLVNLTLDNQR